LRARRCISRASSSMSGTTRPSRLSSLGKVK
jgi:hypothetical protein